jgi:hypothetical protein
MRYMTETSRTIRIREISLGVNGKTGHSLRVKLLMYVSIAVLLLIPRRSSAAKIHAPVDAPQQLQTRQASSAPLPTFAIFHDRPISEKLWLAVTAALRYELGTGTVDIRALSQQFYDRSSSQDAVRINVIRQEDVRIGLVVDDSITVYLHGECLTPPTPRRDLSAKAVPADALGWVVMENDGYIEPFIHVDCRRIGEELRSGAAGRSSEQRNKLMATAIARVVAHEWIHIETQNSHHAKHGLGKAEFNANDLTAQPAGDRGAR